MAVTAYAQAHAKALGLHVDRLAHIDAMLRQWVEKEEKMQALIIKVCRQGHSIFEGTYGTNAKPAPLGLDTLFGLASITKPHIATLIMKLQEDGLVDIQEPISRYLPEFVGGGSEQIKLWHLLSHVSGLTWPDMDAYMRAYVSDTLGLVCPDQGAGDDAWNRLEAQIREKMRLPEDVPALGAIYAKVAPTHEPGTQMDYFGYGFDLLKRVITKVSGMTIDEYATQALFGPLQMHDTHFIVPRDKWPRMMGWNDRCEGHGYTNSEACYTNDSGNGGLKSTVNDLTRFLEMMRCEGTLEGTRVLSKASVRAMLTNQNTAIDDPFSAWGLGWNLRGEKKDDSGILRSAKAFDHGGWPGSKVLVDPTYGLTAAYCTARYVDVPFGLHARLINMLVSSMEPLE